MGMPNATAWAENLPEGTIKASAFDRIADRYASEDPAAAAEWVRSHADQEYAGDIDMANKSYTAGKLAVTVIAGLSTIHEKKGDEQILHAKVLVDKKKDELPASILKALEKFACVAPKEAPVKTG